MTAARRDLASQSDEVFLRIVTVVALLALVFPYAVLALLHPPGATYTGALFSPVDIYAYIGHMLHAGEGDWLFKDYFTDVSTSRPPIFLFYSVLGRLQPPLPIPFAPAIVLNVARLGLAFVFIGQAWKLYGELLPGRASRRLAVLLLLFTSGIGVYALLLPGLQKLGQPFDLSSPQVSAFFSLLQVPHDALVLVLLVIFLRYYHRAMARPETGWRTVVMPAIASGAISLMHPEKVVVLGLACALFLGAGFVMKLLPRARWKRLMLMTAAMLAPAVPFALYIGLLLLQDPMLRSALQRGAPPSSQHPVPDLLIGYGIPGICALFYGVRVVRRPHRVGTGALLLVCFVISGLILLQFRFGLYAAEGVQVAVAGLAAAALLHQILPRLWRSGFFARMVRIRLGGYDRRRLRLLTLNVLIILSAPTVLALTFATPRASLVSGSEVFVTDDDRGALKWVRDHVNHDDVVLGEPETGEFLVAYGGCHVVFGDPSFTPDYDREGGRLFAFFQWRDDPRGYLARHSVKWLYFGPREAAVAKFDPNTTPPFQPAFRSGGTAIYKVIGWEMAD